MAEHDTLLIHYAEGRGYNLGKAKNRVGGWGDFCKAFSKPTKTKERRAQFDKLSKDDQDNLKATDGWIIGAQVAEGRRTRQNIRPRDLLSLDYDYASVAFITDIELGLTPLSDREFFIHSSRRHTHEKPRIRLFAPLTRPVTPEEYPALARIVAFRMEAENPMPMVDQVSFRVAQMMFKPTTSVDGDWFSWRNHGRLIDPDEMFAWYAKNHGDWRDLSILPRAAGEHQLRETAEKAEDPTTKKGPVGDWCRAYDVPAVIEKFLSDKYTPVDEFSSKPRYSYAGGTTTSGAVVEDGGLFLYSHHGSDPCADRLVNAFDLCRIHLFGELDADVEEGTAPNKWQSYKRMVEFAQDDPEFKRSQASSRYDIAAMFEDIEDDEIEEIPPESPEPDELDDLVGRVFLSGPGSPVVASKPRAPGKRPKAPPVDSWFPDELELDQNGRIVSNMPNAATIIYNDQRLHAAIAFNDFTKQIVARYSIKTGVAFAPNFQCTDTTNGDRWQDFNDVTVRAILEAPNATGKRGYGMRMTERDVGHALLLTARRNTFHPIREYLTGLKWDGVRRVNDLFVRFFGVADNAYHKEIARWTLVASVCRIFEPGHKFDYAPIIQGATGILKSTFIKVLYGEDYFGEIDCKLDDKQQIAEIMAGIWGGELPELAGFHKSDFNAAKAFMRRQFDDVRMAYDKRVSEYPRQCVIWGTTNDYTYLRDPTGNRSYWPVVVQVGQIDIAALAAERDQLWAEAVAIYREMRAAQPRGTLPLTLTSREAIREAHVMQESVRAQELHEILAEKIESWAVKPIRLSQWMTEWGLPAVDKFVSEGETSPDEIDVIRTAFTREQAVELALRKDRGETDYQTTQNVGKALPTLTGWQAERDPNGKGLKVRRIGGKLVRAYTLADATPAEIIQGYRVVSTADAVESEPDEFDDLI